MPSQAGSRPGLTLIEVVAGLAIAGTLLATTIAASNAHRKTLRRAEAKTEALEVLDQFLGDWSLSSFSSDHLAELRDTHQLTDFDSMLISEHRSGLACLADMIERVPDLNVEIVRVSIYRESEAEPLLSVDIVRRASDAGSRASP